MKGSFKIIPSENCILKAKCDILNVGRAILLVNEVTVAAAIHKNRNILIDLRDARIQLDMGELIQIAAECGMRLCNFKNKIAVLIPPDEPRPKAAKRFRACMEVQRFQYQHFEQYEDAINWFSESSSYNCDYEIIPADI